MTLRSQFLFTLYRCGTFYTEKTTLKEQSKGTKIVITQIALLNLSLV